MNTVILNKNIRLFIQKSIPPALGGEQSKANNRQCNNQQTTVDLAQLPVTVNFRGKKTLHSYSVAWRGG